MEWNSANTVTASGIQRERDIFKDFYYEQYQINHGNQLLG
jgi:hypothetical protein